MPRAASTGKVALLGNHRSWIHRGSASLKYELQNPHVRVGIRGSEFPVLCCFQSVAGEVSAWPGGDKFSLGDVSRTISVNANRDSHFAVNRPQCACGNVWQHLTNDLPG